MAFIAARMSVLENLALKTAFQAPVLSRRLSAKESRDVLIGWLNSNSSAADAFYGEFFQDPAMTALYADEVRSITDELIKSVEDLYNNSKGVLWD
jgi:hypothetical protein